MIVARTPFRLPLAGGLSDVEPYAGRHGGVTVSTTIDKHVYVTVKDAFDGTWDLRYGDVHERPSSGARLRHALTREAARMTGLLDTPLQVSIQVDLPPESGLGSSGAATVALLNALHAYKGEALDAATLLHEACRIEVEILEGASGYHDPSICALGGLRRLDYAGPDVSWRDVRASEAFVRSFERSLLLFYSGRHARSKPSLALLSSRMGDERPEELLHEVKALGVALDDAFAREDLAAVARCIGRQQELKQRLPGSFEDDYVRDVVERVRAVGAQPQLPGGKISAFVIVCCPDGQHDAVRAALSDLREVPFRLEREGAVARRI